VRITSTASEDSPHFLPDGEIVFRAIEGGSNFLYRMKADGSGRRKITTERILDAFSVSPDGRWFVANTSIPNQEQTSATKAYKVDGGDALTMCLGYCLLSWDVPGKFIYVYFPQLSENSYALPVLPELGLPKLPSTGFSRVEDLANTKNAVMLPRFEDLSSTRNAVTVPQIAASALSPSVYAYTRQNTRRNLYRIQLP
jgi:hypothetical protein